MPKKSFRDLPQQIPDAGYHVNMDLNHIEQWIEEEKAVLNPDFQRGHVWTEQQQIAFLEWFFTGGITGRNIYFNSPDYTNGGNTPPVCVDGLQRLTAVRRFLNNEIPIYNSYNKEFDRIPFRYNLVFHINNLPTKKEVLQWYLQFNGAGTPHTNKELDRVRKMVKKA